MNPTKSHSELLRQILENIRSPERLDDHPWTGSLTVQAAVAGNPTLRGENPGTQLVQAVGELFRQMKPATPPNHDGKRLDTRWGRFGILAASYFAPLLYGRRYPRYMRDAWRRIDPAILLFVFGKPAEQLQPEQLKLYEFIGGAPDIPANSTISDWHRGGLQELAEVFLNREQNLSRSTGRPSAMLDADGGNHDRKFAFAHRQGAFMRMMSLVWHWGRWVVLLALLLTVTLAGLRGYAIYQAAQKLRQDVADLRKLDSTSLKPENLKQVGPTLERSRADLAALSGQVAPWLVLTGRLGWVPVYGGDLLYAGDLLQAASATAESASRTYQTMMPIADALQQKQGLGATELTQMLIDTRPSLLEAQSVLGNAMEARQRIQSNRLSPEARDLVARMDPYISALDQALSLGLSVPALLGGTDSGPKTYLILVENEDELRPTGGFITAVGKVVVWNGELLNLTIQDSRSVDNMDKAYPRAPWQMQSYMNIPIMVLRDVSWFTDYPRAVHWAEYLYAYSNSNSVDGVIAIDQHVLATLLSVTGPVYVDAIQTTVTAENVRAVMRTQKVPPPAEQGDPDWQRKKFMNPIAAAILERLVSGKSVSWEQLLKSMVAELDQRHMLVQVDDEALTKLLADRGWDGAVRNGGGDFLMVVDTNMGYNKTNAVVGSSLAYDVNLTNLEAPGSSLVVSQQNNAQGPSDVCAQWPTNLDKTMLDFWYPIDRCYYDYLRVYVPTGAHLTASTPHPVTRDEMVMLEGDVPARVDTLDEKISGVQGFGTLLVVPMESSLQTSFQFSLPAAVVEASPNAGERVYSLKIQKQAGTVAVPVTLRVHLPAGSKVESVNLPFTQDGANLLFNLDLRTDITLGVQFRP